MVEEITTLVHQIHHSYHNRLDLTLKNSQNRRHSLLLYSFNNIEKSIRLSKVLVNFKDKYFRWEVKYIPELSKEVCALKQINNLDSQFRINIVM
jgi:hypothetical protein